LCRIGTMATDISLEKTLPCNLEAERSVLGAILLDDKAIHTVIETVRKEDFYLDSHRRIFEKMFTLTASGTAIDLITLKNELQRSDELESAGGPAYLASLTDGMPRAVNVEYYASIVKEKATLRRLIQVSNEIMARSYQNDESAQDILTDIEKAVFEIASRQFMAGFAPIEPLVSLVYKGIEEVANRKALVTGVETGFADLDRMTAGLHASDLIIVAARPGLGKTSLCLNIAQHVALKKRQCVGIFSLEMSKEQLVKRLLCAEAEVDSHRVNTGHLNREDWGKLGRAAGAVSQAKIFIDDTGAMTITEMRSKARRLSLEHGLDLLIVDYLQLMSGSNQRFENRTQEISQISRGLKALAKEINVPVLAVSQLNRAIEARRGERRPQLSDLRESGSIEQDADIVLFIYREDPADDMADSGNVAEIIIEKQRNGPTGKFQLAFMKQFTKFADLYQGSDE
jgi:replicative DNA helicase